ASKRRCSTAPALAPFLSSAVRGWLLATHGPAARQKQVQEWHAKQREEHRQRNAPEDGDGERLLHLAARADSKGEGREARDRGEGGHQDRPQAHAAGADKGSVDVVGAGGAAGSEVEEQDAVLGD